MGTDFTVVMKVRHRFGDAKGTLGYDGDPEQVDVDSEAPFVGAVGTFEFGCPDVDSSKDAILQFQYRGSEQRMGFPNPQPSGGLVGLASGEHPVSINGRELAGGVPAAPSEDGMPIWSTRLLLIDPGVLREQNVLQFQTDQIYGTDTLDDFTIDNVVVLYKTRSGRTSPVVSGGIDRQ